MDADNQEKMGPALEGMILGEEKDALPPEITLEDWMERRGIDLSDLSKESISQVQSCLDDYNEVRGNGSFYVLMEHLTFTWEELEYPEVLMRDDLSDEEYDELSEEYEDDRMEHNRSAEGELSDYCVELHSWRSEARFLKDVKKGHVGIASSNAVMGVERYDDYFYYQNNDRDPWNPQRWEVYCTVLSPVTEDGEVTEMPEDLDDIELLNKLLDAHIIYDAQSSDKVTYDMKLEQGKYHELKQEVLTRLMRLPVRRGT